MTQIKNTFLLIALLLLSSCGYHLRGSMDLPEGSKIVYLQGESGQLHKAFNKTLKSSGGKLVGTVSEADIAVQIVKEDMDRRVLSLSPTGRVNEFEIVYTLHFLLLDNEGKALSEKQKIEISQDYFNDQGDVLGKNNEERVIRKEMYRQTAQSIIRRTKAMLNN